MSEWRNDPTGRHQLRWWDGQGWTDHVADDGATSTDPYLASPPIVPTPNVPPPAPVISTPGPLAPVAPTPVAPVAASPVFASTPPAAKKFPLLPVVGSVVVAVALVVVLVFVVGGGGGGGGSDTVRGEIGRDVALGLSFSAEEGEVVLVYVEPLGDDDDVEFESGLLFPADLLRDDYNAQLDYEEATGSAPFFEDYDQYVALLEDRSFDDFDLGELDDEFGDGYFATGPRQTEFPGPDSWWAVIEYPGDFAVVVQPIDGSGQVEIRIERCPSTVDLVEYWEAIGDNDELFSVVEDACEDLDVPVGS